MSWGNEFADSHLLGPEFDSILNVQVWLSQIRYAAVQLALHCFWLLATENTLLHVAACNLFARKVNFLARLAVPINILLSVQPLRLLDMLQKRVQPRVCIATLVVMKI